MKRKTIEIEQSQKGDNISWLQLRRLHSPPFVHSHPHIAPESHASLDHKMRGRLARNRMKLEFAEELLLD